MKTKQPKQNVLQAIAYSLYQIAYAKAAQAALNADLPLTRERQTQWKSKLESLLPYLQTVEHLRCEIDMPMSLQNPKQRVHFKFQYESVDDGSGAQYYKGWSYYTAVVTANHFGFDLEVRGKKNNNRRVNYGMKDFINSYLSEALSMTDPTP